MDKYEINKGEIYFYARIMPGVDYFEILELKVRGIYETYFTGVEKDTKQVFPIPYSAYDKYIFKDRDKALKVIKAAQKNNTKKVSTEKYYEEY